MLKWLVTKAPATAISTSMNASSLGVTEDPLATLSRGKGHREPIYAVSRVNPIFEDDEGDNSRSSNLDEGDETSRLKEGLDNLPKSPSTDRESIKSSGYGSKEADSVSYNSETQDYEDLPSSGDNQNADTNPIGIPFYEDQGDNKVPKSSSIPVYPSSVELRGNVAQLRKSFEGPRPMETDVIQGISGSPVTVAKNSNYVSKIEAGCAKTTIKPTKAATDRGKASKFSRNRINHLAEALRRQSVRIQKRRERERLKHLTGQENFGFSSNNFTDNNYNVSNNKTENNVKNIDDENTNNLRNSINNHYHKPQVLRFNPLVKVVAQDRRYVTGISVSPNSKAEVEPQYEEVFDHLSSSGHPFPNGNLHPLNIGRQVGTFSSSSNYPQQHLINGREVVGNFSKGSDYPQHLTSGRDLGILSNALDYSQQLDSLISEETIRMMNSPDYDSVYNLEKVNANERVTAAGDIPTFGKAIYSNFYHPVPYETSGRKSTGPLSGNTLEGRRNTQKKGANVVRNLWERSGLKTNGRKLLVDVNGSNDVESEIYSITSVENREHGSNRLSERSASLNCHLDRRNCPSCARARRGDERTTQSVPRVTSFTPSSTSHSYEEIPGLESGVSYSSSLDDAGRSLSRSKSSWHFQHNLTEFQKRVNERLQGSPELDPKRRDASPAAGDDTDGKKLSSLYSKSKKAKQLKSYPGKAVKELGLEGDWRRSRRSKTEASMERPMHRSAGATVAQGTVSNISSYQNGGGFNSGLGNGIPVWDQLMWNHKDRTLQGRIYPHPNSEAPILADLGGMCQDFTMDAKRSHRIMKKASRARRRRRACVGGLVVLALVVFVGAIVGLSSFSTGGERLFGPM